MMRDQLWNWLIIAIGATAGVLMRMGQWRRADGRVDWVQVGGECMAIPGITILVAAFAKYVDPDLDVVIVSGLASLVGVIGTAGIQAAFKTWWEKRVG